MEIFAGGPAVRGPGSGWDPEGLVPVLVPHGGSILPLSEGGGDLDQEPEPLHFMKRSLLPLSLPTHVPLERKQGKSLGKTVRSGVFCYHSRRGPIQLAFSVSPEPVREKP